MRSTIDHLPKGKTNDCDLHWMIPVDIIEYKIIKSGPLRQQE